MLGIHLSSPCTTSLCVITLCGIFELQHSYSSGTFPGVSIRCDYDVSGSGVVHLLYLRLHVSMPGWRHLRVSGGLISYKS